MKKIKKITSFISILLTVFAALSAAAVIVPVSYAAENAGAYEKIPENADAVSTGAQLRFADSNHHMKYMNGSSDGLFHPDGSLTRAEIAQIFYALMDDASSVIPADGIQDVSPDDWYYDAARVLTGAGVTELYDMADGAGYFRPHEQVTRAQLVFYLSKFSELSEPQGSFPDVPEEHWAYREIMSAAEKGWVTGYEDGSFLPSGNVTRAEAAAIMNRVLGRAGDDNVIYRSDDMKLFPDISRDYWAYAPIMEATVEHDIMNAPDGSEVWSYYVREKTVLAPGYYNFNGALYCVSEETGDFLRNRSDGLRAYGIDGRYTSGNANIDNYIRSITADVTDDGMTQYEKLKALFDYVVHNYDYIARELLPTGAKGWEERYAEAMFLDGRGNCYSFAAIFYYLSLNLGYEPVGVTGTVIDASPHGWVEMTENGQQHVYDPEITYALGRYVFDVPWDELPYRYVK